MSNDNNMVQRESALTAMCIWEELQIRSTGRFAERQQMIGTAEFREEILDIAPAFDSAWVTISENYDDPFDWAFVPAMINLMEEKELVQPSVALSLDSDTADELAKTLIN